MKNVSEKNDAVSEWVEEALNSLKGKCEEFPKIKHTNHHHGQLATIAEKSSQENLLSNYLKHQSKVKHISGHHSETVNYGKEVYREDTRRSLDNPHQQKSLYSDLERIKGKEQFFGPKQADHRKFVIKKNKMPLYNISKLIWSILSLSFLPIYLLFSTIYLIDGNILYLAENYPILPDQMDVNNFLK